MSRAMTSASSTAARRRCQSLLFAIDLCQAQQALRLQLLFAGLRGSLLRLLIEFRGRVEPFATELQVTERDQVLRDAARQPGLARQVQRPGEVALGGIGVAEQQVEPAGVVQRLGQFRLCAEFLVDRKRGTVGREALVVLPELDQAVALLPHPVRLVLAHAGLLCECDGLVEMLQRVGSFAEPELAERDVAVVLAHRGRGFQLLADRERLLVVAQRLLELSEQQVHATDVAERVADAARKVDAAIQLEHLGVLRQRGVVVAQFVVHQAQVIERGAFESSCRRVAGPARVRP